MDVVITRCAGLDVHQATVVATVRVPDDQGSCLYGHSAKLSSRTFWNFVHEFSSFRRHGRLRETAGRGAARFTQVLCALLVPDIPLQTHEPVGSQAVGCR
jgi:hypothetical protein